MDHPRSLLAESLWQILLPGLTMTIPLTGHAKLVIGMGAAWRLNRRRSPPLFSQKKALSAVLPSPS